jgi:hypothetical protein
MKKSVKSVWRKVDLKLVKFNKAHSVIDTTVTESLMIMGFETIFGKLKLYTDILINFDPIDYSIYTKYDRKKETSEEFVQEIAKISHLPDQIIITKLLRLIEIFTSISKTNTKVPFIQ